MAGCRACNWDVCLACFQKKLHEETLDAISDFDKRQMGYMNNLKPNLKKSQKYPLERRPISKSPKNGRKLEKIDIALRNLFLDDSNDEPQPQLFLPNFGSNNEPQPQLFSPKFGPKKRSKISGPANCPKKHGLNGLRSEIAEFTCNKCESIVPKNG